MASELTAVHLALGLLDQHSFKTLEHAVQQFKDHKQRFHDFMFELKSLKPSAGILPDTFSHPSSHSLQARCTSGKPPAGGDSLGVSTTHLRCTLQEPPLKSTVMQEGIENCGYSLRPRASRKLSSSGAPQRITRSRGKQPATSTGAACNNLRKSEFIVLEDDFVEARTKEKRKAGKPQQAFSQGVCLTEAAESGCAKAFPNEILEQPQPSSHHVTATSAQNLLESCEQELLTPSSSKGFDNAGKKTCHSQEVITSQKQPEMCKKEVQAPSSLKRAKHLDKVTFSLGDPDLGLHATKEFHLLSPHFVQQIPLSNKDHSVTPCQNIVNSNMDHVQMHLEEGTSAKSFSRNFSTDTNVVVFAKSPSAHIHLPISAEQLTKQICNVVQCEVNQEKRLPTDAEDGPCIISGKEDDAFVLQPSSITLKHSLLSTCQRFNETDRRESDSHKRKLSVFEISSSGFVPRNGVKRRKRISGSVNSIEVEAFKFDVDDACSGKDCPEYFKSTAANLGKVYWRSLCLQGDFDQARQSVFREPSSPGINDSVKIKKFSIEGGEAVLDWHVNGVKLEKSCGILSRDQHEGAESGAHARDNRLQGVDIQEGKPASLDSVNLEKSCGILSPAHHEGAVSGAHAGDNRLQGVDIQEGKPASLDSIEINTHTLHQALEKVEPSNDRSRNTYTTSNNESQFEAAQEKDSLVVECPRADRLLLSNPNSPAVCISTKEQSEQEKICQLRSDQLLLSDTNSPVCILTTAAEVQPCLHELSERLSTSGTDDFVKVKELSFGRVETGLDRHLNSVASEKPCGNLSQVQYDAGGGEAHGWDDSLQGVLKDIQEGRPSFLPESFQVITQDLRQAHETIETSFDSARDTCREECENEVQPEASTKQDGLVLECACADQLPPSNLNSPANCFLAKVQPEQEKLGTLQSKSGLLSATSAEVQPCLHEHAEGIHTPGINNSGEDKIEFSIGRVETGLDLHAKNAASEKLCGILSQAHDEVAGSGAHAWNSSMQDVVEDIQEEKPTVPDSFQVNSQELHQAHETIEPSFEDSRYTHIEECKNESQAEAPEKQDDLVLECGHAGQMLLSDSNSLAVCFSAKVQPEQEILASRNFAAVHDDLRSCDGLDSFQRQVKSSQKLCKSYSRLSGLRIECTDTPRMNSARAGLANRSSAKFKNFEWHLDACLEDGKENQTPDLWLNKKGHSGKGLLSENQKTPGTRKVLECSNQNQSLGGLVESMHKRYNLAVETRSFLDLVQQKQLPLPYPNGRREVRVKALEAAELARRQEERRENERKMRKLECSEGTELEACKDKMTPNCASTIAVKGITEKVKRVAELKLKMDQEKAKKQEVEQKKKEEERKKKEAEFADKKRKREDADRKDREEKRKRVEEVQKIKKEQEERQRIELEEKEHKRKVLEERERERKAQEEEAKKLRRLQKEREAERRRKQEQHLKASRLAEKQAERKRKEAMLKARGFEDDAIAQLAMGNKLSLLSTESFAVSSSMDWEGQSKSTIRTRSQTSEGRWGLRVPSLGASVYCQTNNGKLSTSASFAGNGTPFPVNTAMNEAGLKFEPPKGSNSQYTTPFSSKVGLYASAHQIHLESNNQTYEISPYKSSSDDDDDDDGKPKKPIPLWARKENLLPQILWQQCMDPDDIFCTEKTCSLAEIFGTTGSRRCKDFGQRSATGDWLCDYTTRKEELDYKKAMGYIQG